VSLKKKVVKGFAWNMLQGVSTQLISFTVFLVLARLLGPESFGLVAMATVAIAFFQAFREFGFGSAIIQREDLEPGHLDTAFWTDIIVNVVMMVAAFLSAKWIANLYSEPRLEIVIQAFSLLFLPDALSKVQTAILRREFKFKALAIRTLIAEVIGGVTGIVCALYGLGVWSLVARQLTTTVIGTLILWILSNWRPGLKVSRRHFSDLFGFGVNMFAANLVGFFGKRADSFLIGYYLGPVSLGYYTIATRLVLLLIEFLGGAVNNVAWPAFARLQNNPEKMRRGFYSASQLLALIVMPVFMGIYSLAPELVPLMFGSQWGQSIPLLKILVFVGIINSMNKMYDSVIVGIGKPGVRLSLRVAISISNVLGFFFAIRWGGTGVALAYVIIAYTYLPIYFYILKKLVGIKVSKYFKVLAAPITAATMMTCSVFAVKPLLNNISIPSLITISIPDFITIPDSIPSIITIPISIQIVYLCILITVGVISYILSILLISPATIRNLLDTVNTFRSSSKTG